MAQGADLPLRAPLGSPPTRDQRGECLASLARRAFGQEPSWSVRAPGRVNLIGEHVDYCDLAVLPMAIQRDVRVDLAPRSDARVRVANRRETHAPFELELGADIAPAPPGHWSNYVRAAAQHAFRELGARRGADLVVDGTIPEAAGLSSSSALVVASLLALLAANGIAADRLALAAHAARAERYVGTNSGGMDQAISLLAVEGAALRVGFAPLSGEPIPVPRDWRFVIADSLVVADKSGALRASYNARRAATERALEVLAPAAGLADASWPKLVRHLARPELLALCERVLDGELRARARHVITENARVDEACAALRAGEAARFGAAMDGSQRSLREDCEVSTPELDRLCELAREHGARGARLTGAGLGGAIVALVDEARAEALLEALRENYYAGRLPARELGRHLLIARASAGAG